ncbi:MAG: glutamate-5-semialdehyde dehydrogenase [Mariprofundaceae bacterium]|nr:glutamate-5-semialdehyde dehydrogenase [Mariprofundaceae bacterium]
MTINQKVNVSLMDKLGQQAKAAAIPMRSATSKQKNQALLLAASILRREHHDIITANQHDMKLGREKGLDKAMMDRLMLDEVRIEAMTQGLEQVAALPDPVGTINELVQQPSGIQLGKMRTPIGVIGMIYESRPNVTVDAAALCLKSGNAVILRGGSESIHSNRVLAACLRRALVDSGLAQDAVQLVDNTDRALVGDMLRASDYIDVIIPRGGRSLTERVANEARIPVIKHLDGICHVYVDAAADLAMASDIAVNAKTQRCGVCNALETLLVHEAVAESFLPQVIAALQAKGVEVRGCEKTNASCAVEAAQEEDWSTEYLALILSIRVVSSLEAAVEHINTYGSAHTDSIVSENYKAGQQFIRDVDSSSVMWNASTRFADGFEYGLGAEIGISTDRLHVRGPVGLEGLTTQKWVVFGHGEIRQ